MLKVQQEITVLEVPLPGGGGVTCDTCFSRIYVYRTILGMRGTSVISRVFGEMVGASEETVRRIKLGKVFKDDKLSYPLSNL